VAPSNDERHRKPHTFLNSVPIVLQQQQKHIDGEKINTIFCHGYKLFQPLSAQNSFE
jgi:hypothetical protein